MDENQLPAPGIYKAKTSGQMVYYKAPSGSWCIAIPVSVLDNDGNIVAETKYTATIQNADFNINLNAVKNLMKMFGWDGMEPKDLQLIQPGEHELKADCIHDEYDGRMTFKIKWLNPPTGGPSAMPEPMTAEEAKEAASAWSSRIKALLGGAPAKKPATKPAAAPAKAAVTPKAPTAPAKHFAPPAKPAKDWTNGNDVWDALEATVENPKSKANQDALATRYYEACQEVAGTIVLTDIPADQWPAIAAKLGL